MSRDEMNNQQLQTGSNQQAFEALGKALGFDPGHHKAILAAGCMMQEHGDYDVALSKYRIAAAKWPDSAQLWNNIAMCFYGKRKYVAAMSCLKRANYLAPLDWKILANLGMVHEAMQQHASAFNFLSSAINLQPKVASLYSTLAVILVNLKDKVNAEKAYQKALHLDHRDPLVPLNYAIFLLKQGQHDRSAKFYKEFVERISRMKDSSGGYKVEAEIVELGEKLKNQLSLADDTSSNMSVSSQHA